MLGRALGIANRLAGYAASLILISIAAHIMYEVILRTVFARSTHTLEEIVGYSMAALSFLALGSTLENGTLMRVNMLPVWLGRWPGARRMIELVCCAAALAVLALPIWFFGVSVLRHYRDGFRSGTMADVPAWLPEALLLFGMVLFWLQLFAYGVLVATGARDAAAADRVEASHLE